MFLLLRANNVVPHVATVRTLDSRRLLPKKKSEQLGVGRRKRRRRRRRRTVTRTSSISNRSSSKIAAEAAALPKAKPLFEKVRKRGLVW